jgi:hypothetical protein
LGDAFTARDAARTFSHAFTLDEPRDNKSWPVPTSRPVPAFMEDDVALGKIVSGLGTTFLAGIREQAADSNIKIEGVPDDPEADIPPSRS